MNNVWQLETHGKPLETVHNFLSQLWEEAQLEGMMMPLKQEDGNYWKKEVITSPDELSRSNPFTPIMAENIAQFIPEFLADNPHMKLAILLRPCEMRAYKQIQESISGNLENIIIISADCLGTFPKDEFSWRATRKGSQENLAEDTIRFSRQGGIAPYRYRAACQLCKNPIANEADININIVGVPVRQNILISTPNGKFKEFSIGGLSKKQRDSELVEQHLTTSAKLIYRNQQTKERLSEVLVKNTSLDLESLVLQLNECGDCTNCMDVCPICAANDFSKNEDGSLSRDMIAEWMISCVGCGMCEQACSQHKPLAVIFSIINDQLSELDPSVAH